MIYLAKLIFSTIEFFAMILVCLSLFRIYFRYSLHKVLVIALAMSGVSIYIRDFLQESAFSVLPVLVIQIVLITMLFELPLIFSFLVCVVGSLATATAEGIVVSLGSKLNLFSKEMQTSIFQFMTFELIVTFLLLLLLYPLQKYKLGFHTTSNDALKGYNFLLSAILVVAVVVAQIQGLEYQFSSIHIFSPILLGILFLIGIFLSYKHNKKLWKNRRERLSKK